MDIRLYDTMARAKRVFEPADPKRVTMYVCGPTVYGRAHIGNARPAVVFDVLARVLRHKYGNEHVVYARNVTDIDDKIMAAAAAEGVNTAEIAARHEANYLADMAALGVRPPDRAPHATEHVPGMIAMIERLIAKGAAYAADGHVLFDVAAMANYGALSRRPLAEMIAGARVEIAPYKRGAADFVLWKPSTADQPGWPSPWGRGRPGWHIECSAMIASELGETIDIHAGGLDLIFPHHENEVAQSACAHDGAPLARYWLHNGFLSMAGGDKMSKSLGNVVTVADLLAQGWHGEVIRLALLSAHYRQPLEWSDELLRQSRATLDYVYGVLRRSKSASARFDPIADADGEPPRLNFPLVIGVADDLGTPEAISHLYQAATALNVLLTQHVNDAVAVAGVAYMRRNLVESAHLIGIAQIDAEEWFTGFGDSASITSMVDGRMQARARRDFSEADRIRDELAAAGIVLEDRPDGTTDWRRA